MLQSRVRAALAATTVLVACSAKQAPSNSVDDFGNSDSRDSGNGSGGSLTVSGGTGGTSGGGAGGGGAGGSGGGTTSIDFDGCAAQAQRAEAIPVDMYVMFDKSVSMNEPVPPNDTRWTALKRSFKTFLGLPESVGIGLGIQYFGLGPPNMSSCNAGDYATPEVEIAPLGTNATAIRDSINAHTPDSDTPTVPALQGAIDHAKAWEAAHSTHVTVVLLATDGLPYGCGDTNGDLTQIVAAATSGFTGSPSIKTFVIGVPADNANISNLSQIATAGGTTAFLIDPSTDVAANFLDALNKIRGSVQLACEYTLPESSDGTKTDPTNVNITFTAGTGSAANVLNYFYKVDDASKCDPTVGGWYYEKMDPPTLKLCDKSCMTVSNDQFGLLEIAVGCASAVPPLH